MAKTGIIDHMTVHYLDQGKGCGEVVFETETGEEFWSVVPDHKLGRWVKSALLRKRTDFAMSAAIGNRTKFPPVDAHEVSL